MARDRVGDEPAAQRQMFGHYHLEELIGRGGMGEVYCALDTRRDRVVALKILPPAMAADPLFEARFRRESQLVARLSAPHIIPIHDFGEIDGRLFLDMRLVRGVDLSTVLESGPLSPHRAVEMASQMASALDAAHEDGLVHRDVKPSNVLYVGDPRERPPGADEADFAYLVDFGIASSLDPTEGSTLTATGHAVGTLGYMAPERFNGEPADRRVDVYALACTLYEALTGRPAFPGDALAPLMYAHLHRMPTAVSRANREVPRVFDEVLARGLAKRAADRFGAAGELAEAARTALRSEAPRARPAPTRPGLTAPVAPVLDVAGPLQPPARLRPVPADATPLRDAAPRIAPPPAAPVPADQPPGSSPPVPWPPVEGPPVARTRSRRRALRIGAAALAVVAAGVVGFRALPAGPGTTPGPTTCAVNPLTCNDAATDQLVAGGEVTVAVSDDITNWNVAAPEGSVGPALWAMGSVLPYAFGVAPDYSATLNTDLLTSAEQTSPTTVVYRVKPGASWDDGTPVGVDDFAFTWRMRNGRDCPGCPADPTGYQKITAVSGAAAADGGSTVTVTFSSPAPEWRTLFASTSPLYPAHVAARQGDLATPDGLQAAFDWLGSTRPDYSAGPMVVQDSRPGEEIVLARNPKWYGRPARLDRVVLKVITDPAEQVSALRDGRVQVITPTSGPDLASRLNDDSGVEAYQSAGTNWERLDLNLRTPALTDPALRRALFAVIDVDGVRRIGAEADGGGDGMFSHTLVDGQAGFTDVLAGTGQGAGNVVDARQILTAAGYTGIGSALVAPDGRPVPPLRAVYTSYRPARKQSAEYVAKAAGELGLTVTPTPTDTLAGTLSSGDFDLMFYGWGVSPAPVADAVHSWSSTGSANYIGYSNRDVDRLLAAADSSPDAASAQALLTQADQQLTKDAVVLPLYRKPTVLAVRRDVANVRDNPVAGPLYNVADWGLRTR